MATPHRNACTIEGAVRDALLNGDTENYSGDNGYTIHSITKDNSKGITVQLNQPYLINCVRMLLWDKDNRSVGVCMSGLYWSPERAHQVALLFEVGPSTPEL